MVGESQRSVGRRLVQCSSFWRGTGKRAPCSFLRSSSHLKRKKKKRKRLKDPLLLDPAATSAEQQKKDEEKLVKKGLFTTSAPFFLPIPVFPIFFWLLQDGSPIFPFPSFCSLIAFSSSPSPLFPFPFPSTHPITDPSLPSCPNLSLPLSVSSSGPLLPPLHTTRHAVSDFNR